MWTCPKCMRKFSKQDQSHSCHQMEISDILNRRSADIVDLVQELNREISQFGSFRVEAIRPDVLFYKTKSTFVALKVKTKWIDIEFFLERAEDVPPVKKLLQTSKRRFLHVVSIDGAEDIDGQLIEWMHKSYLLITNA